MACFVQYNYNYVCLWVDAEDIVEDLKCKGHDITISYI